MDPRHRSPPSTPQSCTDRGKHEAIKRSTDRMLRCLGAKEEPLPLWLLICDVIEKECFLAPWIAYRDEYLLNPEYNDEGFLTGGEKVDTLFEDIVRKFHERSRAGMNGLSSQDEDGRAHTVRLYSSLLHGLTQKGGFYELRDVKVTCTMRRMCDELYTLVKHLRREYVHGHGVLMDVIEERCPSKWLIPKEDDAEELPDADSIGENTVEGTDLYTPQNEETTQHEDNQSESEQPESYQSESRTYYPGFTENESSSEEATETDNITLVSLDFGSLTEGTTPHFPQNESSSEESSSDSRRVETGSDSSEDVPATTQFPLPSRPRHVPKPLIVDYSDSEELPEADVSTSRQHHEPQPRRRVRMPFVVSSSDSEEPQEDRLPSPMNTTEYMPQEEGVSLAPNELFFSPTPDPSHHSSRASSRPVGKFAPLIETVPVSEQQSIDDIHLMFKLQDTQVDFNMFSSDSE